MKICQKEKELQELQTILEEKQNTISDKESIYDKLVDKQLVANKMSDCLSELSREGLPIDLINQKFQEILSQI